MGKYEQELIDEYKCEVRGLENEIDRLQEKLSITKGDLECTEDALEELEVKYDKLEEEFSSMRRDYTIIKGVLEYVDVVVFRDGSECKASEIEKHFNNEVNMLKIIFGGR
jgi:septation ring formation regulator EzrA